MNNIILNYGDSQGEVIDYVFYNNKSYIKYEDDNRVGVEIRVVIERIIKK